MAAPAAGAANETNNQHNTAVAQRFAALVSRWQRGDVQAQDIYRVLADAVLPETRPAEVFLYTPTTLADPSQP